MITMNGSKKEKWIIDNSDAKLIRYEIYEKDGKKYFKPFKDKNDRE